MSAKPSLVLFAAWTPSKGDADELVATLAELGAGGGDLEVEAYGSAIHAGEALDLPGVRRLLGRFGIEGVIPE